MKFKNLFFVLIFTSFSEFMCMENEENFSQEKADEQLLSVIKKINIHKAPHEYEGLIAENGEKIIIDCGYNAYTCNSKKDVSTIFFNATLLEECVLAHMNDKLVNFNQSKKVYIRDNLKFDPVVLNWSPKTITLESIDPDMSIPINLSTKEEIFNWLDSHKKTKHYIRYLLFDPKAPKIMPKEDLIKKYIPTKNISKYECFYKYLNKTLKEYLEENFPYKSYTRADGKICNFEITFDRLSKIKEQIESYLKNGGSITLPLAYCILHNDILFSKDDNSSSHLENSTKLAEWLLHDKRGWFYLDKLLAQVTMNVINKNTLSNLFSNEKFHIIRFMRCLELVKNYNMLTDAQKRMDNVLCKMAYAEQSDWVQIIIDHKLTTPISLNNAFLATIDAENKYSNKTHRNHENINIKGYILKILQQAGASNDVNEILSSYIKNKNDQLLRKYGEGIRLKGHISDNDIFVIKLLFNFGADPNILFFLDEKGKKRCYLHKERAKELYIKILIDPRRKRENEPLDFENLQNKVNLCSIKSKFDNGSLIGQESVYEYGKQLCNLALSAYRSEKIEDLNKLRQHIIQQKQKPNIPAIQQDPHNTKEDNTNESLKEDLPTKQDEKKIDITNQQENKQQILANIFATKQDKDNTKDNTNENLPTNDKKTIEDEIKKPNHQNQKKLVIEKHGQRVDDHPTQQIKLTGDNTIYSLLQQKLYSLFGLFRPSNLLQNIYNLPRILLGKLYSLKSII